VGPDQFLRGKIFDYEGGNWKQLLPPWQGYRPFLPTQGRYEGLLATRALRDSSGTMQYANGDRYEGALAKMTGPPMARGNMTYANGDVYRGAWKKMAKSHGWGCF
jgi:hypothetical protein